GGAEQVPGDGGDRLEADPVERPREHDRDAAARRQRSPDTVGEPEDAVLEDRAGGARPVACPSTGRGDRDNPSARSWVSACASSPRDATAAESARSHAPHQGVRVIRLPYRSPRADSLPERSVGTTRQEVLDHLLILDRRHLEK